MRGGCKTHQLVHKRCLSTTVDMCGRTLAMRPKEHFPACLQVPCLDIRCRVISVHHSVRIKRQILLPECDMRGWRGILRLRDLCQKMARNEKRHPSGLGTHFGQSKYCKRLLRNVVASDPLLITQTKKKNCSGASFGGFGGFVNRRRSGARLIHFFSFWTSTKIQ